MRAGLALYAVLLRPSTKARLARAIDGFVPHQRKEASDGWPQNGDRQCDRKLGTKLRTAPSELIL